MEDRRARGVHDRTGPFPQGSPSQGGEAANTLQLDRTSRHATTANAKVERAIAAPPLIKR